MERTKTKAFNVVSLRVRTGRAQRFYEQAERSGSSSPILSGASQLEETSLTRGGSLLRSALAIQCNSRRKAG